MLNKLWITLRVVYRGPFISKALGWAFLKDFEFAIYYKRRTQNPSKSLKKPLLRQKDDKITCMVLQINDVVVVLIV